MTVPQQGSSAIDLRPESLIAAHKAENMNLSSVCIEIGSSFYETGLLNDCGSVTTCTSDACGTSKRVQ